jgi:hypothetical protein
MVKTVMEHGELLVVLILEAGALIINQEIQALLLLDTQYKEKVNENSKR